MNRSKKKPGPKPAKKKPGLKPKSTTTLNGNNAPAVFEPFEIITDAEPPRNGVTMQTQLMRNRVDVTMNVVKPGQAFIVPFKNRGAIASHLKNKWPSERFTLSKVLGNDEVMRVYWHPPKPKK